MKCPYAQPVKGKFNFIGEQIMRPCGKCAICRRTAMTNLVNRATYEFKKHKFCAFVTLTYDKNHLYYNTVVNGMNVGLPSVCKKQVSKFFDDFRHYLKNHNVKNCDKNFTYLYSLEYGGEKKRPHAHIIFFGVDFPAAKKISAKLWENGFIESEPVDTAAIRYVAKYLAKSRSGNLRDMEFHDRGIEPPKVSWSKGLGKNLYFENYEQIKKYGYIQNGQKRIYPPAYYKNKIVNANHHFMFNQYLDTLDTREKLLGVARRFGFNDVEQYQKNMSLNSIRNELRKNINRKSAVDLAELQGAEYER